MSQRIAPVAAPTNPAAADDAAELLRLYWWRIATLLLEVTADVFRSLIRSKVPADTPSLFAFLSRNIRNDVNFAPSDDVANAWRGNNVDAFDFSAALVTLQFVRLFNFRTSNSLFVASLKSLNAHRKGIAAHPTKCTFGSKKQFDDVWTDIDRLVVQLCSECLPKPQSMIAKFKADSAKLLKQQLVNADLEERIRAVHGMQEKIEKSLLQVQYLNARVSNIERRGTEFDAWLKHHTANGAESAALEEAFDQLCEEPHFYKFARAEADGQLKRYSDSAAAKEKGVTLYVVRASYSSDHLFSIVYATAGVVCDKPFAISFDCEQKLFTVAGLSSVNIIDLVAKLVRERKFEALDTSTPDGFYWHESETAAAPAPVDADRVAQLEERVRRLEEIIKKHLPVAAVEL